MRPARLSAAATALLLLLTLNVTPAAAQTADYVTTTYTNLRQRPAANGARLRTLPPNDTLSKRTVTPRTGWIPVRTSDGLAGWVSEPKVRDLQHIAAAGGTTITPSSGGAAAARIDPTWDKPPITTLMNIRVQGNTLTCGPTGDGADDGTNFHKTAPTCHRRVIS